MRTGDLVELGPQVVFRHPWWAPSFTRAPRSRNNVGFIGRWRLRVTRASIRIGWRGIWGWLRAGLVTRWRHGWSRRLSARTRARQVRGHGDVPVLCG
jgi:hypothetical protein